MKRHFEIMANYNEWANARLFRAAETLDEALYRKEVGAYFRSLHGTLNHLLVSDRIWMRRFTGTGDHFYCGSSRSNRAALGRQCPHEKRVPRMSERSVRRTLGDDRKTLATAAFPNRRGLRMTAQLNHTIVYSSDRAKSARFLAEILGLPAPVRFGPFGMDASSFLLPRLFGSIRQGRDSLLISALGLARWKPL